MSSASADRRRPPSNSARLIAADLPATPVHPSRLVAPVVIAILVAGCQADAATRSAAPPGTAPARQFDPAAEYIEGGSYPEELVAVAESDLIPMVCSPEFFSWTGTGHEFVDPVTLERTPLSEPILTAYLEAARDLHPDEVIVSVSRCDPEEGPDLVTFRVGPCGGGCAGIPQVAFGEGGSIRSVAAVIQPDGDGPYFGCVPIQWTRAGTLYLSCLGEGTALLRRADLVTGEIAVVLRCQSQDGRTSCTSE